MFKKKSENENKKIISKKKIALVSSILGLCVLLVATSVYFCLCVNIVSIFDGNNTKTVYTLKKDVHSILANAGYNQSYNILSSNQNGNKISIEIAETFPVYITYGEKTVTQVSTKSAVKDIIAKAGITLNEGDIVSLGLDEIVEKETYIDIIPAVKEETVAAATEQKTEEKKPTTSSKPSTKPTTSKKPSSSSSSNSSSSSSNSSAGNTSYPGAAVNTISTLVPNFEILLDENGIPVNYKSSKRVQATAYTHTGNPCSTGVWPQPGYIAVDPKVIPYGTKMYIVSADGKYVYGYAIAADTGGFIKTRPTNVDLFFNTKSACKTFGRRDVIIYFL